jgi:hypothetical protein
MQARPYVLGSAFLYSFLEPNAASLSFVPRCTIFLKTDCRGQMTGHGQSKAHESVIDENLRRVYQEAVDEGIPDRFKSLLEQLKKQDRDGEKGK